MLSCRVPTVDGEFTLSGDEGGIEHQPFVLSCWARGGPEDGQCREFGRARGVTVPIGPPPPEGSYDFDRSWTLATVKRLAKRS